MHTAKFRNSADFKNYFQENGAELMNRRAIEDELLARHSAGQRTVMGYSYQAREVVDFEMQGVSWREDLACPKTGLSSRLRSALHIFDSACSPSNDDHVYITEQTTPAFRYLSSLYPNLVGSEFLPDGIPGKSNSEGIRHEDLTQLSFETGSLDSILSFEVLEHIPDFVSSLVEMARVLKPGGHLVWTAPFLPGQYENLRRAEMLPDGTINHIEEPEYHGDPIQKQGILCFHHFGWQLLDQLKEAGFRDAYASYYWSAHYGYYGGDAMTFVCIR